MPINPTPPHRIHCLLAQVNSDSVKKCFRELLRKYFRQHCCCYPSITKPPIGGIKFVVEKSESFEVIKNEMLRGPKWQFLGKRQIRITIQPVEARLFCCLYNHYGDGHGTESSRDY